MNGQPLSDQLQKARLEHLTAQAEAIKVAARVLQKRKRGAPATWALTMIFNLLLCWSFWLAVHNALAAWAAWAWIGLQGLAAVVNLVRIIRACAEEA